MAFGGRFLGATETVDLSKKGIALKWNNRRAALETGAGARSEPVDLRTAKQMRDVLMSPQAEMPEIFYHMYRNVCMKKDMGAINGADLYFCITVWPAFSVGGEHNKTYGHFHSRVPGTELEYPEIYEVIAGNANFIQQANDGSSFTVIGAKQGDKVIVPPGCGHVTVNVGKSTMLTLDCHSLSAKSDYGPFKEMQGAMYYDTVRGFVKNKKYETAGLKIPELVARKPELAKKFGFGKESIYKEYLENPEIMDFLKRPQDFLREFGLVGD